MTRLALRALLLCALCLGASAPALAFNNEPEGWEEATWSAPAEQFIKGRKDLRGKITAPKLRELLKTRDVLLDTSTDAFGKTWAAVWTFGADGLKAVTLRWEDNRAEAFKAHEPVLAELQKRWGPPDQTGPDGELIWEGWKTRATARRQRLASGSGVEIVLERFEGKKTQRGPSHQKSILDEDSPGALPFE
jgi:hypothetical protein